MSGPIAELVGELLNGLEDEEEKCLKLAAWCAENIENGRASAPGSISTLAERKGFCGARARLYVEMVEAAGGQARIFGMYTPGLRHTVTHVLLNGKYRFVDPEYGVVCRMTDELASFEEMHRQPALAASSLEFLKTPLRGESLAADVKRTAHARKLYNEAQLGKTRSFGFLRDERPVPFWYSWDFSASPYTQVVEGPFADRVGFIECGALFGLAAPNFFGATDKWPAHIWEFSGADVEQDYQLWFELRGLRRSVEVIAESDSVRWLTSNRITISSEKAETTKWQLCFSPTIANPKISIASAFDGWGKAALILRLGVGRAEDR